MVRICGEVRKEGVPCFDVGFDALFAAGEGADRVLCFLFGGFLGLGLSLEGAGLVGEL